MFDNEEQALREQFEHLIRDILPSKLVTNFIIIAEVAGAESSELSVSVSAGMSPWLASGMLELASEIIMSGECSYPGDNQDRQ
jgi:hypothetical protein